MRANLILYLTFYLLAALKKWRDISNDIHETTVTLANEFQEASLAATFNFSGQNVSEDKTSVVSRQEVNNKTEEIQEDNQNHVDPNEYSYSSYPTTAC